jgi:hypothetical protein
MPGVEPPELARRAWIRDQALSEHAALVNLNFELLEGMRTFRENVQWGKSHWAQDGEFLELVDLHRVTLACANELALDGWYREGYNAVRTAFEGYFLLRLIGTCEKYEFTYIIKRSPGDRSLEEAVSNVERQIREKQALGLVSLERVAKDRLVAVRRGRPIMDDAGRPTGRIVPQYYAAWKQYRPDEHHLSGLQQYLEREWSIVRGTGIGRRDPRHRQFYRDYFTFDGMVDKLRLNRVLTKKTAARASVHYNFLSGFSHTTHRSVEMIVNPRGYRGGPISLSYNHYHSELLLLYVCHLAGMFLDLALRYFRRWRIPVKDAESYAALVQRVQAEYSYFWFIFNGPHLFDRFQDANRLSNYRRKRFVRPEEVADPQVRYYEDPLNRLRELHLSTTEFSTGNVFVSPFPRADAWRYL